MSGEGSSATSATASLPLDLSALEQRLRSEGFHTYVWQDGPNACYSEHSHATETAHIVLAGEMTLGEASHTRTYRPGERCDAPAGAVHWARMGPTGCRYLIGEK